ncbi:MAG: membrane dipeptidase [Acidobacteriota bacterium]
MSVRTRRAAATFAFAFLLTALHAQGQGVAAGPAAADPALVARAKAIHERAITLDTHNDINTNYFTPDCNYTMRLTNQVNLPKMSDGGLDVSFMIVYVGQGPLTPEGYDNAYRQAIAKFEAIHRLTEEIAPDRIALALTPADVRRLVAEGKRVAVIGIENGYPIGEDIRRVKEFYDRGGRYLSLAHNGHSQLSDSNTGEREGWKWNGLSPLGKEVIAELNRLGIMIDISHPSKASMMQTLAISKAPIIASHSSVRALANHSRNLDDEQLLALKKNGGVAQMVALSSYVKADPPERSEALARLRAEFLPGGGRGQGAGGGRSTAAQPGVPAGRAGAPPAGGAAAAPRPTVPPCPVESADAPAGGRGAGRGGGGRGTAILAQLPPERRAEYEQRLADIDAKWPAAGRATVRDFVDHIDYAVRLVGIDHVGISSDFDGGGGVDGWNSAAESFNVTLELVRRGYTEEQVGKLWSGNLLRVWEEVAKVAQAMQTAR